MSIPGISERLRRLEGPHGRLFLLALDHGLPAGPLPGLEDPAHLVLRLRGSPITGMIANPGVLRLLPGDFPRIVHLSAGTVLGTRPTSKVLATPPEDAIALGADAVSVQVHFGDPAEDRMLADVGRVADAVREVGLPLLVMAYPPSSGGADPGATGHAARAAAEIGAHVVQVPHPGDAAAVRSVVRGCPAPVVVSGGPRAASEGSWIASMREAIAAGAMGVSAGRNVFQHPDPARLATRMGAAIFDTTTGG